jgi:hypothetical protein
MLIDKKNKKFIDLFFNKHRLFFCDDFPWQFFNYENGTINKNENINVRADYLFSKCGFFRETLKERDINYINKERQKRLDFTYYHRQRRYIVQELIDDNFFNPTHHSFKPREDNSVVNFYDIETFDNAKLITHPGHTRFQSSCFLRKNLNKCFVYVNKEHYRDDLFTKQMKEIKNHSELFDYWNPKYDDPTKIDIKNGTKYHKQTECNVLKLWDYYDVNDIDSRESILHSTKYIDYVFDSSEQIADTLFEKKLTIYTNSNDDVKLYFKLIRNKLVNSSKKIMAKKKHTQYFFDELKHYDFDVVVVDKKPKNISELNENKGFAIWIDKSILYTIKREIYEFTFFTRKDIKSAETEDGKISITNCRYTGDKRWKIHKEFYS